eukprot:gene2163-1332_t
MDAFLHLVSESSQSSQGYPFSSTPSTNIQRQRHCVLLGYLVFSTSGICARYYSICSDEMHHTRAPQHLLPLHPLLPPTAVALTPASPYDVLCTVLSRVIMPLSLSLSPLTAAPHPRYCTSHPPTPPDPHTCPLQSLRLLCCSRSLYLNRVIMGHFNACFQELKEVNWGDNACYDCCTCNPCCGSPDLVNALRCFANWLLCVHCKLSAAPMDQEVACSPHCMAIVFTRYGLRRRSGGTGKTVGDWICMCCGWRVIPECDTADLSRTALLLYFGSTFFFCLSSLWCLNDLCMSPFIFSRLLCLWDKIRPAGGKNNNNNNTGCGRGKAVFVFVVCAGLRCSVCGAWGVHSWEAPFWRWIAAYSWQRVPLSTPPFTAWTALSRRPSPSGSPYAFNYTSVFLAYNKAQMLVLALDPFPLSLSQRFPGEDEGRSRSVLFEGFHCQSQGQLVCVCARAITSKRQYLSGVPEDKTKEGSAAVQGNGVPGAVQPPIPCLLVRYPPPPRPSPPLSVVLSRPFASLLWFPPSSLGVVKATGILGCLGISQIDWGGNACYELYATSLGQKCAFFPHCVCCCFCGPCMTVFTRYNLRRKAGVKGNMVGDWICTCCCGCCACCQNLRSVPIAGWRVVPEVEVPDLIASNICSFFSINVSYLIESCIDICLWWRHPDHSPAAAVCLRRYCRGAVLVPPRWPRRPQPVDVLGAWADIVHGRRRSFFARWRLWGTVHCVSLCRSAPPPSLRISLFREEGGFKIERCVLDRERRYWSRRVCPTTFSGTKPHINGNEKRNVHSHIVSCPCTPLLPPTAVALTPASPYDVLCTVLSRVIMPLSLSLSLSPLTAAPHPRYCTSHPPTPPDPHTCPLQSLRLLCCSRSLYLNRVIMGHFNACFQELKEVNWGDNACYDCCTCNPAAVARIWSTRFALRGAHGPGGGVFPALRGVLLPPTHRIVFTRYGLRRRSGGTGKTVGDWICMCCGWRVIPECDTADLSRTALLLYFGSTFFFFSFAVPVGQNTSCWGKEQQQQQHWMRAGEGCVRVCCVCRSSLFGVRGMGCSLLGGPLREVDRGVLMGACTSFYSAIHRMDSAKPKAEPQRKPIPSLSLSQRFPGEDEGRSRSVLFLFDSLLCSLRRVFIVRARGTEYQKIKQKKAQPPCKGTVFPGPCSPLFLVSWFGTPLLPDPPLRSPLCCRAHLPLCFGFLPLLSA